MTTTESAPAAATTQIPTAQTAAAQTTTGTFAPARTLSIVSLVLGIFSIVTGQAVILPAAAIVLGVLGYRQEPAGRAFAVWGIVVGAFALFGWLILGALGLAFALPWLAFAGL